MTVEINIAEPHLFFCSFNSGPGLKTDENPTPEKFITGQSLKSSSKDGTSV
jgi:hypothetical protein